MNTAIKIIIIFICLLLLCIPAIVFTEKYNEVRQDIKANTVIDKLEEFKSLNNFESYYFSYSTYSKEYWVKVKFEGKFITKEILIHEKTTEKVLEELIKINNEQLNVY